MISLTAGIAQNLLDIKLTLQWLVTALLSLVLGMGAYSYKGLEKRTTDAEAATHALKVELTEERADRRGEYRELIRELNNVNRRLTNIEEILRQNRKF